MIRGAAAFRLRVAVTSSVSLAGGGAFCCPVFCHTGRAQLAPFCFIRRRSCVILRPVPTVNVARYLPERARAQPGALAVRVPAGDDPAKPEHIAYLEKTFAQLDTESDAAARLFAQRGIARGTRVLLLVKPGLDLLRCVFALFKVGAVPIVIDPGMGLKSFLACVHRSEPAALVVQPMTGPFTSAPPCMIRRSTASSSACGSAMRWTSATGSMW